MFQDFFNYKIIMFDKPVYNQNCIGLTENVFLLSCRTWSGIKITNQLEYKIWNISPGLRVYAALRWMTNENNLKYHNNYFRGAALLGKETQTVEVQCLCAFQETPWSCRNQSNNYLFILLRSGLFHRFVRNIWRVIWRNLIFLLHWIWIDENQLITS